MADLTISPGGIALSQIDRLTSITATAGTTLVLTSDGVNQTLTNSVGNLVFDPPSDSIGIFSSGFNTTALITNALGSDGTFTLTDPDGGAAYLLHANGTAGNIPTYSTASGAMQNSGISNRVLIGDDIGFIYDTGGASQHIFQSGTYSLKISQPTAGNAVVTYTTTGGGGGHKFVGSGASYVVVVDGGISCSSASLFSSANSTTFTASILPTTDDGAALGIAGGSPKRWADIFLASGAVINFNSGASTITHSTGKLTFGGSTANGVGIVLPAGGTSVGPMQMTTGPLLTAAVAGGFEYLTNTVYVSPSASSRGILPATHFASNVGDFTMTYAAGAGFPWLQAANDTLTLIANTTYFFEGLIKMTHGTTTHTTSMLFAGTWTVGSILYETEIWTGNDDAISTTPSHKTTTAATSTVLNATAGTAATVIKFSGVLRVTTAGTLIPQVAMSADPTGTILCKTNSYFRIWAAGSDTNAATGNWA